VTRGNTPRTRNARLAAIKSFARFVEYRVPSCIKQIYALLAIPSKEDRRSLSYVPHPRRNAGGTGLARPGAP